MSARGGARREIALGAAVAAALLLCAATAAGASGGRAGGAPALATPLPTSIATAEGTWATVPMGDIGQPLNTFWQLFFDPASGGPWTDDVQVTATATNGGLVMAANGSGTFLVGVRPSDLLTFSPVLRTADAGVSWSEEPPSGGLAPRPDSLALGPGGQALALAQGGGGTRVLSSAAAGEGWRALVTAAALVSSPAGRGCEAGAVTAVGYEGATPVVGLSCAHAGVVGIAALGAGGWTPAGPALAGSLARDRAEVLSLRSDGGGLVALIAATGATRTELVAAWDPGTGPWKLSAPLALGTGTTVASVGPDGGGMFVLLDTGGQGRRLVTASGPGSGWGALAAPPAGTATVAVASGGTLSALAVDRSVLTVWTLGAGSAGWTPGQVVHVSIPYGSSS